MRRFNSGWASFRRKLNRHRYNTGRSDFSYAVKSFFEVITPREILLSLAIIAAFVVLGLFIDGKIDEGIRNRSYRYETALQVNEDNDFSYALKTDVGDIVAYGTASVTDPVCFPDCPGEFSHAKKEEEHYTMHTETYTVTVSDGDGKSHTETRTRTYWSWDHYKSWYLDSQTSEFLSEELPTDYFTYSSLGKIKVYEFDTNKRYVFTADEPTATGTLFISTSDDTHKFYNGITIDKTINSVSSRAGQYVFRVVWIIIAVVVVVSFLIYDNDWLED